jgi:hypothetical protein
VLSTEPSGPGGLAPDSREKSLDVPPRLYRARLVQWAFVLIPLGILAGGAAILFVFNPADHGFYPFCIFYRSTGLLCPGCGSLRSLHQLVHGNLAEAFRYNPLLILSLPLVAYIGVRMVISAFGRKLEPIPIKPAWFLVGLGILVCFGILRNLPFEAFACLRHA